MSLAPLLAAGPVITLHALLALALIPLTLVIFSLPRGSRLHRRLGWAWSFGMAGVALSSFAIHDIRLMGPFSPIHLISIFTLAMLAYGLRSARRHHVTAHRRTMIWMTWGALAGAGAFTLLPGRVMHAVLFGG